MFMRLTKEYFRSGMVCVLLLLMVSVAYGKQVRQKQPLAAEKKTLEYIAKYPEVRSDSYVYKTIKLPNGDDFELDMRIERPKTGGPFPVVIYVHGGGWVSGSKEQFAYQSFELAKHGIAGVRIEYRLVGQGGTYAKVIGDVMDAVDTIRKRADELKIDFSRVGLAGGSAGGHLSAIAAQLTPECICYDGFNGLYDVVDRDASRFGGGKFIENTVEAKKKASAMHLLRDHPPDTFLYHGTEDTTIDIKQSQRFAKAIQDKGGQAQVLSYEGVGHGFFNKEPYLSATTQALLDHTRFVFGLSDEKPQLSKYAVPPKTQPANP